MKSNMFDIKMHNNAFVVCWVKGKDMGCGDGTGREELERIGVEERVQTGKGRKVEV